MGVCVGVWSRVSVWCVGAWVCGCVGVRVKKMFPVFFLKKNFLKDFSFFFKSLKSLKCKPSKSLVSAVGTWSEVSVSGGWSLGCVVWCQCHFSWVSLSLPVSRCSPPFSWFPPAPLSCMIGGTGLA